MKTTSASKIKGHLEIFKIYLDGTEEKIWDEHNVITSGMAVNLAYLLGDAGSLDVGASSILEYQIKYFQIGVSGTTNYGTSTNQLASAIPLEYILSGGSLIADNHTQIINGIDVTDQPFIYIGAANIFKSSPTSVRYHLVIPADELNDLSEDGVPINEIGLFAKNPTGSINGDKSILVAYKYFSNILKTSDFALLFRWVIYF